MRTTVVLCLFALLGAPAWGGEPDLGPTLPYEPVVGWAKLPDGWNFGMTTGVAVDSDDSVWVYHRGPHGILHFAKDGKLLGHIDVDFVVSAHGIGLANDGNIWITDVAGHMVFKISRDGKLQFVLGNAGGVPGGNDDKFAFNRPAGVFTTPSGRTYVADGYANTRVVSYDEDGDYITHWGKPGTRAGEFNLVHDVTVGPDGTVYVADRANDRVQVFDADGKSLAMWEGYGQPWGVAYDANEDCVWVADGVNNRVVKFSPKGKPLGHFGEFGKAPGRLDFAHHIAVDSDGAIYVAEIKNWRVQKFVKSGD